MESGRIEKPAACRVDVPRVVERVSFDRADAAARLASALLRAGLPLAASSDKLVLICVGTDRSTGDALGPLVGSELWLDDLPAMVLGTLDRPVHAGNIREALMEIGKAAASPLVIAVDASLGRADQVGTIALASGALRPGAGVNKSLPAFGEICITGTVNVGGFMEYAVLQNTRLCIVMKMARVIAAALKAGLPALWAVVQKRSDAAGRR